MPRRDRPSHRAQVQLAGALAIAGLRGGAFSEMEAADVAEYCVELAGRILDGPGDDDDEGDDEAEDLDLDDLDDDEPEP